MKRVGIVVMALVLMLLQTGCTSNADDNGKVELTYWPAANPVEVEFAKEVVKEWNAKHPNIQVKMQPLPASRSAEEVLLTSIAAGTTPDVCSNINPSAVGQFVQAGGLLPIDSIKGAMDEILKRTPKETVDAFKSKDGHLYQVPWKGNPVMILYNKQHFRQVGLNPDHPGLDTYSKFLAAARKLTRNDIWAIAPNVDQTWWQRFFDFYPFYLAATNGKTLLKNGKADFNNPYGLQVMQFFRTLFQQKIAPQSTFKENLFAQGKVSMVITGPYALADVKKQAPNMEVGVMPIPVPDNVKANVHLTYGDPKNIAIFRSTRHPKEAWEFIKFLISKENDIKFLEMTQQIPFRKDLAEDPAVQQYLSQNPVLEAFVRQAPYTRAMDDSDKITDVFDALSLEYQQAAVMGKKDPRQALSDAEKKVNEILQRSK